MRKWIVAVGVVAMLFGGAGAAMAGSKSGSGAPNTYGLCTAANNGNKNGWSNQGNGAPPAFQGLLSQGESAESSQMQQSEGSAEGTTADARQDILQACAADGVTPGGQGHGAP